MAEDRLSGPFLHQILAFIDPPDLYRCMRVSHGFNETIKRNIDQLPRYRSTIELERTTNKFQLTIKCDIYAYKQHPSKEIHIVFDGKTMYIYGSQRKLFSDACKSRLVNGCLPQLSSLLSSLFWFSRNFALSVVGKRIEKYSTFPISDQLASFCRMLAVVLEAPLDVGHIRMTDCSSFADEKNGSDFLSVIRDSALCYRRLHPEVLLFHVPDRLWSLSMEVLAAFDNRKLHTYFFEITGTSTLESIRSIMRPNKWLWLILDSATIASFDIVKELLKEWLLGKLNIHGLSIFDNAEDYAEPFARFIRGLPLIEITENGDNHDMKGSFGRNIDDRRLGFEIEDLSWILYNTTVLKAYEETMNAMCTYQL